ncbi:uncharacterized protein LOC135494398 isoform X2 [Lineus longissimus]|uniref:uncharacterized protein LOC135494398 isoform X2 n=1 Tax=Lineus longissimus TaxID=88925 RepID=UPI00315D3C7E
MMANPATPQERFWDHQRDGLTRIRKDLLKKNSLNKANSRANSINGTGGRANSLSKADREKEAQKVVRRASLPTRSPSERSGSQISYAGVPSRSPSITKDNVPHKVLIGRPDAFKGKETPPVPEPKVNTPPGRRVNNGSPGPRNGTPPSQLPRMKSKPRHEKERLPRSRYNVVPPVPPRRAFYQPTDESNEDSWGETESDDSYDDDGFMGAYPYPIYVQPQPMFAPQPMYYHQPRRHRKRKKKVVVIREPPKPYTMDQATYTIDHRATQWDDPEAGQLMDVGIDPMHPYVEMTDRSVGTFDVRRGDTKMSNMSNKSYKTTASERERRRQDRERWERERAEYHDFEMQRRLEQDRRNRELAERDRSFVEKKGERGGENEDRSYKERKGALDRDQAYKEKMARERERILARKKRQGEIDFVGNESVNDSSSEGHSDLYNKLKARQKKIDYVADDPVPADVARRLRENSSPYDSNESNSAKSLNSRHPVGSVKSFSGSVYSPAASYKNDPQDPPPLSEDEYRPTSYEEISFPVPNIHGSDVMSSTQTLGPSRRPKFYYHYTQSRPRYLQDRNALFDERTNSVLRRYKYGTDLIADRVTPDINLPRDLQMIKHFLDYPDFANTFTEALIADFLDEDIIPDVLIETISHMNTLPATHPMFHPSKQVANDIVDTEVIWMAKGIVGEVAREFVDGYLEEQFNQKKDPLEEFLDDLFNEVVFDGATEAAREAVLELADIYVMNSSIFDYLLLITDEIIREEAASVLDEALEEMILEDFVNDELVEELIEEEAFEVAHEVLTEYDTKLRRKTVKDIDRLGRDKLLESLILNDILRRIAHQAKIWTESEYMDKVFNSLVADVLLHEYLDVLGNKQKTIDNRPLRKVHEKMVTDVALDVLLDELCQGLDEDLGELDTHEVGGLPDEASSA